MKFAIIGAGFGGLVLANILLKSGNSVTVFEKSRGVGGRMSTRYAEPFYFDHGAQCFTARRAPFKDFLLPFIQSGIVQKWQGNVISIHKNTIESRPWKEQHLVPCPNMNSLIKSLQTGVDVKLGKEVLKLEKAKFWKVICSDFEAGDFDHVVITAPPVQAAKLIKVAFPSIEEFPLPRLHATFALMLGYDRPFSENYIAAKIIDSKTKWLSVNSSKPQRNNQVTSLVIHAHQTWSNKFVDADLAWVEEQMLAELANRVPYNFNNPDYKSLHRWRYAILADAFKNKPFIDIGNGVSAFGDWCCGSRIENVYETALQLSTYFR